MSNRPKLLDTYFKQNFAQVTNPPIDPIREELVMSLVSFIGPRPNLLDLKGTSNHMRLEVAQPILTNEELERIRTIGIVKENPFRTVTIDITYDVANGPEFMEAALEAICTGAERAVQDGYNIIILSDRAVSAEKVPIGNASSSDPQRFAHLRWDRGRIGRAPRGASVLHPCRLRGRSNQSLSGIREFGRSSLAAR
jgi:glutamate synthase (NADPH/NADH) large chain